MTQYRYTGDSPRVFASVQTTDGSTLLALPNETYELLEDPKESLLVAIADKTAAIVSESPESTPEAPQSPAN